MANTKQVSVRFKLEDFERIKAMAEAETRPPSNFITWLVLKYINNEMELKKE